MRAAKKRMSVFAKVLISVCLVIILVGCIGLYILWSYLSSYEDTRATAPIESFIELLSDSKYDEAISYGCINTDEFGGTENFKQYISSAFKDGKGYGNTAFRKASKTGEDGSVTYSVYCADKRVFYADVIMSDEKNSFDRNYYELKCVRFDHEKAISVTAPATAVIKVNGKAISPDGAKDVSVSSEFGGIAEADCPKMRVQKLSGYVVYPEITVVDGDGTECYTVDEDKYNMTYFRKTIAENESVYKERALTAAKNYSGFVTRHTSQYTVLNGVLRGSKFYKKIAGYDNKWYGSSTMKYGDSEVFNIREYDASHFIAEVKLVQNVRRFAGSKGLFVYNLHYKISFVKKNNNWYITDLLTIGGDDITADETSSDASSTVSQ